MNARPDLWAGAALPPHPWQQEALPLAVDAMRAGVAGVVVATMGAGKSYVQGRLCFLALEKTRAAGGCIVVSVPSQKLVEQMADSIAAQCGARNVGRFYTKKKQHSRTVVVCCNDSLPALHVKLGMTRRRVTLMIVDEAHKSESDTAKKAILAMNAAARVGFTATPFRSLPKESLSLWHERPLYRYTMQDAVRDGVLVPLSIIKLEGTELPGPIDDVCFDMIKDARGPGIISATGIDDAEAYAAFLCERGFPAKAIHSKLSDGERAARLEELRTGSVRALVHVSLLAEGVDMPWLWWLCARRKVGARVRYFQEFGRVMRVDRNDPSKVEGVLYDPHLLTGRFGMSSTDALGKMLEEAAEAESRERTVHAIVEPTEEEAVALDRLIEFLDGMHRQLKGHGIVRGHDSDHDGWRLADVSEKQVAAIKQASKLTRHIHGDFRDPIKTLVKVPYALTRGQAADLLDVLYGSAGWARKTADEQGLQGKRRWNKTWGRGTIQGLAVPTAGQVKEAAKGGRRIQKAAEAGE